MKKQQMIISAVIETHPVLTLDEICSASGVTPDFIQELIEYGVIDFEDEITLAELRFNSLHLQRVRTVVHLKNDLDVNLPGAALVLDLLDEIETMRSKMELLEKHLFFTVTR